MIIEELSIQPYKVPTEEKELVLVKGIRQKKNVPKQECEGAKIDPKFFAKLLGNEKNFAILLGGEILKKLRKYHNSEDLPPDLKDRAGTIVKQIVLLIFPDDFKIDIPHIGAIEFKPKAAIEKLDEEIKNSRNKAKKFKAERIFQVLAHAKNVNKIFQDIFLQLIEERKDKIAKSSWKELKKSVKHIARKLFNALKDTGGLPLFDDDLIKYLLDALKKK